jgi:NAD(P)-dependent dehydrogenase (short-subunit alcohol dehydrogenase family)
MVSPRIVLTGGSKGMGLAVLRILLERYNARVTTLSRSYPVELKTVVEKYGPERVKETLASLKIISKWSRLQ